MELAKHRVQCIQKYVSYKEHIHQIIYKAYSPKQLSVNASLGVQHAADLREQTPVVMRPALTRTNNDLGEHRFNLYVLQRSVSRNNCTPTLETSDPRMCHVLMYRKMLI